MWTGMGLLKKWFSRAKPPPPHDDYWYLPFGATDPTLSGVRVDEETAIKYLTVYDCVSLVSGDVSNLPLLLYRHLPGKFGKERATDHPKYDLFHTAINEEITSRSWVESGISHNMLWGNHYALKIFNGLGKLIAIWPFPEPSAIEPYRSKKDNRIHYKYRLQSGEEVDKTRDEILHIPGWGFNGIVGISPITIAREAIGLGLSTEQFGQRFFSNGTHPSGILSMPPETQRMGEDVAKKYLETVKQQVSGLGKSHSIMLLRNGETYHPLTMPLDDAQFLESRQFQKLEIAGMYHVPPHKIAVHGANSNYNNEEQENRHYVDSCLLSWLRRWETCLNQQVLTIQERRDGYFFEFLIDGLLRGDSAARVAYYTGMKNIGAITNNEIRSKENMNPLPDDQRGDETTMPLNFMFVKDIVAEQNKPEPEPVIEKDEEDRLLLDWAKRSTKRSIIVRDRIVRNYKPLIYRASQVVVYKEVKSIKAQVNKIGGERDSTSMDQWLDDFYQEMAEYIKQKLGPTLESFAQAIADSVLHEIGDDKVSQDEIDTFIANYINTYIVRHSSSSVGQIKSLLAEDGGLEKVVERVDEWEDKRAEKITENETVRLSNGMFSVVVFAAGMSTIFRIRGKSTCPYCRSLEGRVISKAVPLLNEGDEIKPSQDHSPMVMKTVKYHPPIHQGCDCYIDYI
jgi:HK97 family phage portal protein